MKSILMACAIVFHFICNLTAQEVAVTSKVSDVTVYRSIAKETRIASVTIPAGNTDVVLSNISTLMTDRSLQVSVKGSATLLSATVRMNYFNEKSNEPEDAKAGKLRDSIKVLEIDLRWLAEERSTYNGELALVSELLKPVTSKEGIKPADINAMADIYRSRFSELKRKLFDLSLKEEAINSRRNKFQGQLNEMGGKKATPVKEIVLSFSSEEAASLQLRCSYLVTSVGWTPLYDINVENTSEPVNLTYKASLVQRTGIDWKNVNLTISSANPSMDNNRPILSPRYVDYASYVYKTPASGEAITNMMTLEKDDMKKSEYVDPYNYHVDVNENDIQVEFVIDAKQNIPADGKEHICKLQTYQVPATYKYHAVPKLDPSAFLLARITDYGQYNLLSGEANIFFGDTYVGQVALNPQITADTLLLSLGRDERIVVKRTRVDNKLSRKLFSGVQKDTYSWETTIRNNKGTAIDIEILDQVPLTRREEIKVKLLDKDGAEYDEPYGKLLWNFTVKPNESQKVKLVYTVEYPEKKQVQEQ